MKQAVLALPDTTKTAPENWTASFAIREHLVAELRVQEEFRTTDHSACLQEVRTVVQNRSILLVE